MSAWIAQLDETFISSGYYKLILEGFRNTIIITAGALVIGVFIGVFIATIKYLEEDSKLLKPLARLCSAYVEVIRGIPVIVLLLVFYYIILKSSDGVVVAILTFGINSGAYMAELIRSGINAVDNGQMEAGRSLGMTRFQATYKIVFPQALRYVLPAIGNEAIALLKETSVAGYVAVVDLTRAGNLVRNNTFDDVNTLLLLTVSYLVMVLGLSRILKFAERTLSKHAKR